MKCDTCLHKNVCRHYSNIRSETYAYIRVSFDPDTDCQDYISVKLKKCPFCGGIPHIIVCDDEGNHHPDEYENNPWSGLGFMLYHNEEENPNCPIAHEAESQCGRRIYDSREEATLVWNRRIED